MKTTAIESRPKISEPRSAVESLARAFVENSHVDLSPAHFHGTVVRITRNSNGLASRFSEGRRRTAFFMGPEAAARNSKLRGRELLASIGYPPNDIERHLVSDPKNFGAAVMPASSVGAKKATWAHVMDLMGKAYPEMKHVFSHTCGERLSQADCRHLFSSPELQEAAANPKHPCFMDAERLQKLGDGASLDAIRTFLWHQENLNPLFKGDGFTYDAAGNRLSEEFIGLDAEIASVPGAVHLALSMPTQAASESPHLDATSFSGANVDDEKSAFKTERYHATVAELLNNPDLIALQRSKTPGNNMRAVFDLVTRTLEGKTVLWSGDTEGLEKSDLTQLKKQGFIRRAADGSMELDPSIPDVRLAHTGDAVGDRGNRGYLDCYEMVQLKDKYPSRVTAVWGNRENKFLIHQGLREIASGKGALADGYKKFLQKNPGPDTLVSRMNFWLADFAGARDGLKFHREALVDIIAQLKSGELSPLDGARLKVSPDMVLTDEAVAQHYLDAWKPSGVYFEYLRRFNFVGDDAVLGQEHALTHGGFSDVSISRVPHHLEPPKDMNELLGWYRELGVRGLKETEEAINKGLPIPDWFADLMNSSWQESVGENRPQPLSTIYLDPSKEDGNYRLPAQSVADFARRAGRKVLSQGHKPQAGTAKAMEFPREHGQDPLTYVWHDSSYSAEEKISATVGNTVVLVTQTGPNEIMVSLNQQGRDAPFGTVTEVDGYTVDGVVVLGENRGKFRLSKYSPDGRKAELRYATPSELEALRPSSKYSEVTHSAGLARKFAEAIQTKPQFNHFSKTDPVSVDQFIAEVPQGAVCVLGSSKFAEIDPNQSARKVQELLDLGMSNLVKVVGSKRAADGEKFAVLHGGTSTVRTVIENDVPLEFAAPETLLMRAMVQQKMGKGMGVVPPDCNPDYILSGPGQNSVELLTAVGKHSQDWGAPGKFISEQVHDKGGVQVFVGGSTGLWEIIEDSMTRSRELLKQGKKPALVFLLNHQDNPQGALTASAKAARMPNLPSNFIPMTLEQFAQLGDWVASLESQYKTWNPSDGKAFAPQLPPSASVAS